MGVPDTKCLLMGVHGQTHMNLGILDMKKFENHWAKQWI